MVLSGVRWTPYSANFFRRSAWVWRFVKISDRAGDEDLAPSNPALTVSFAALGTVCNLSSFKLLGANDASSIGWGGRTLPQAAESTATWRLTKGKSGEDVGSIFCLPKAQTPRVDGLLEWGNHHALK